MLSCHYPNLSPLAKTKFDRIITPAATRRFQYRFCHASLPPTFSQPIAAIKSRCRLTDSCILRTRSLRCPGILRVRSYSTETGTPAQDNFDALVHELSHSETWDSASTLLHPSEGDLSRGDSPEPASRHPLYNQLPRTYNRFDWRFRASSRMQKKEREANLETQKFPQRKRLQGVEPGLAGPLSHAFQEYKTRSVRFFFL
jgi:hypothetical protein